MPVDQFVRSQRHVPFRTSRHIAFNRSTGSFPGRTHVDILVKGGRCQHAPRRTTMWVRQTSTRASMSHWSGNRRRLASGSPAHPVKSRSSSPSSGRAKMPDWYALDASIARQPGRRRAAPPPISTSYLSVPLQNVFAANGRTRLQVPSHAPGKSVRRSSSQGENTDISQIMRLCAEHRKAPWPEQRPQSPGHPVS